MLQISKPMLAYTAMSTGFSMMSSVFGFYYVKIFLERYRISPAWFQAAQSLYLVWNAINDPLFAYLQDTRRLSFMKTRREAILYSAPLFSLVFLIPWFPWEEEGQGTWITGVHLIIALFMYDAVFTFVGLAACCLFTEISSKHNDRLSLVRISSVGNILGASIGVYSCEFASENLKNYPNFQLTCVAVAMGSFVLMTYTGRHAHTEFDMAANSLDKVAYGKDSNSDPGSYVSKYTIWQLTWRVLSNKNFLCFVIVNFCQEFHRTWMSNFAVIVTQNLIPDDSISPYVRSLFHGFLNNISFILIICGASVVGYVGSHRVIMWNFYLKIATGLFLFFCGYSNPWILMLCMLVDSGFTGAAYSLFSMSLSDVADEDMQIHGRRHPITSMIFGTNALIVKPAISLSPMLVATILNSHGYTRLTNKNGPTLSPEEYTDLKGTMFTILCFLPVTVAIIQITAWSRYRLRDSHNSESHKSKFSTENNQV